MTSDAPLIRLIRRGHLANPLYRNGRDSGLRECRDSRIVCNKICWCILDFVVLLWLLQIALIPMWKHVLLWICLSALWCSGPCEYFIVLLTSWSGGPIAIGIFKDLVKLMSVTIVWLLYSWDIIVTLTMSLCQTWNSWSDSFYIFIAFAALICVSSILS